MKNNLILVVVLVVLLSVSGYLLINVHFAKSLQLAIFSDCLATVSDSTSGWDMRKGTIDYCMEEVKRMD